MSKLLKSTKENPHMNLCFSFSKYHILVYDHDEITQPHFHVVDIKTYGKHFHCRILINKPKYYKGETTKLSKQDINMMCFMFNCSYFDKSTMDNPQNLWDLIINTWNYKNKQKVKLNKEKPDYMFGLK